MYGCQVALKMDSKVLGRASHADSSLAPEILALALYLRHT